MKKKELEMILQRLKSHPNPNVDLEQYQTPANIAAEALYFAFGQGDIGGKKVVDPGCGTGILAIGAKLLGARDVIALDIDESALEVAMKNASDLAVDICLLTMDFQSFPESCDTIVMNPPFGAQKGNIHADVPFLEQATKLANVIYSFHKAETQKYIEDMIQNLGWMTTHIMKFRFPIRRMYDFHRKEIEEIETIFLRTTKITE